LFIKLLKVKRAVLEVTGFNLDCEVDAKQIREALEVLKLSDYRLQRRIAGEENMTIEKKREEDMDLIKNVTTLISQIPKEKIWLGIHLYGYEWKPTQTVALTYTTIEKTLSTPSINGSYLKDIGEGYTEFGCEGNNRCVMYYQTQQGVQDRRDIAKEYGIAGVSYWRLGGELGLLR
jgi:hypothetical protein